MTVVLQLAGGITLPGEVDYPSLGLPVRFYPFPPQTHIYPSPSLAELGPAAYWVEPRWYAEAPRHGHEQDLLSVNVADAKLIHTPRRRETTHRS